MNNLVDLGTHMTSFLRGISNQSKNDISFAMSIFIFVIFKK